MNVSFLFTHIFTISEAFIPLGGSKFSSTINFSLPEEFPLNISPSEVLLASDSLTSCLFKSVYFTFISEEHFYWIENSKLVDIFSLTILVMLFHCILAFVVFGEKSEVIFISLIILFITGFQQLGFLQLKLVLFSLCL